MILRLNPANLSDTEARNLLAFFQLQSALGIKVWDKEQVYTFPNQEEFIFCNKVFQRERKVGKIGVRYEFIGDNIIGSGLTSTVYNIAGTLAFTDEQAKYKQYGSKRMEPSDPTKSPEKKRVVKIQEHKRRRPVSRAILEYEMSVRGNHLAIKPPTIVNQTSFTVMRELEGRCLFDIISDDFSGTHCLSTKERIELSNALLNALKIQVTNQGLIHGDIKPENINVVMSHQPISVYIFDYGFSTPIDNPDEEGGLTPCYAPPEMFVPYPQKTVKIDVFSMARIIALIWRVDVYGYWLTDDSMVALPRD